MKIDNLVRNIFYFLVTISFLIAFSPYIDSVIGEKLIKGRIDTVQSKGWLDAFLVLTLFFYISIKANNCQTEKPNEKLIFILLIITFYYIYERFFNNYFTFIPFKTFDFPSALISIKYFDILFVIIIAESAAYLKYLVPKCDKEPNNTLLEDIPIKDKDGDKLDGLLQVSADKITKIITENSFKSSFTVGLNGAWGDGKTSVFNLVRNNFQSDEYILIEFNPWIGFDKKVLIKDFFTSLSERIGDNLSQNISEYVDEILNNGDDFTIPRIVKSVVTENKSLHTIFEDINEKIGFLDKKIIVFIDDVDRLDKEEVFEILKLIRKTANFQKFFFIVAYDRNYVNNSIEEQIGESTIKYLDKIINVEINLPYFEKYILKHYFLEELKIRLPSNLHYKIDEFIKRYDSDHLVEIDGYTRTQTDLFEAWLNNFREIKKIINSIVTNYNSIYIEVDLFDVIYLEILKLNHPYIYQVIYTRKDDILQSYKSEDCYYLSYYDKRTPEFVGIIHDIDGSKAELEQANEEVPVFDMLLKDYIEKTELSSTERDKIKQLVDALFPRIGANGSLNIDNVPEDKLLGVKYTTKFERYFSHSVFFHHIKEEDFKRLLNIDKKAEVLSLIEKWIKEDKVMDFSIRVNKYFEFQKKKNYRNILISSLFLIKYRSKESFIDHRSFIDKMFDQDFIFIFRVLDDTESIDKVKSIDKAKSFFKTFFKVRNVTFPYIEEAKVLYNLKNRNAHRGEEDARRFPLNNGEIEIILESYVLKFIESDTPFDSRFWTLYYYALKNKDGKKVIEDSIKNKLKESLNNISRKKSFLGSLITKYGYDYKLRVDEITHLFESFEEFENFFFSDDVSEYVKEFNQFYKEVRNNNWRETQFDFKLIAEPEQV